MSHIQRLLSKKRMAQQKRLMQIEYDDEAIALEKAREKEMAEEMVAKMRLRLVLSAQSTAELRKKTRDLQSSFSDLNQQLRDVQKLYRNCNIQMTRRSEALDEVIYLNRVIKHLGEVEKQMAFLKCNLQTDTSGTSQESAYTDCNSHPEDTDSETTPKSVMKKEDRQCTESDGSDVQEIKSHEMEKNSNVKTEESSDGDSEYAACCAGDESGKYDICVGGVSSDSEVD